MTIEARALRRGGWAFWAVVVLALVGAGCGDDAADGTWALLTDERPEALLAVSGTSARDVYAVGADQGQGPIVLHYDGAGWSRLETGTRGDLWWVHAFAGGPVFFGGAGGQILRLEDGTFERMPVPGLAKHVVYGIWGASPDDVWAVGSVAGRSGFIWHYDGTAWREVFLPLDVPRTAEGEVPGLFKVWGDPSNGSLYVVGGEGLILRSDGDEAFEVLDAPTDALLFTVHGEGGAFAAVGVGGTQGVVLERDGTGAWVDRTPAGVGLLQGVCLAPDGRGFATGARGEILSRRGDGRWETVEHGLDVRDVASLHAVWIDPDGGVWAVGGDVLAPPLARGVIVHFGDEVPVTGDVGFPNVEPPPPPSCPEGQIDRKPDASIARRWNEQILGAIRRDVPRPGVHARNLYHLSTAMWDAWAAYDATADGVFVTEKLDAPDADAARAEAMSYAAYRVLVHRYDASRAVQPGAGVSKACFDAFMGRLGLDPAETGTDGDSPRALGNRIGAAILAAAADDGANEGANYRDTTGYAPTSPPLVVDDPGTPATNPFVWQELNLAEAVTQNGLPVSAGIQGYIGAQWRDVTPFAIERAPGASLYYDPGVPALFTIEDVRPFAVEVIRKTAELDVADGVTMDVSPGGYGNNPLGSNEGTGHPVNPVTGAPYAAQIVPRGDFFRILAEYWADGPQSETPPGHWNVIANDVADSPALVRRLFGEGEVLDPLEWDVKIYLAINGAVHDAAIVAWELKREYVSARPITLIRYMAQKGQSSDPSLPSYDPDGLPLVPGLIELVTAESSADGERHAHLRHHVGEVAVRSWRGEPVDRANEIGGVDWIRGVEWIPYQRRTFVTPAFPGYTSGHSTFSRSAATVLAGITGSDYFPGGLGEKVLPRNGYLVFEDGPSVEVRLQYATYYDAADQAGQSRLYGGIHVEPDDFDGRRTGAQVGQAALARARTYFDGTARP